MIEALMLLAMIYYRSWPVAIIVLAIVVCRRVPWFANAIAAELGLDQYAGLTAFAARLALPAWRDMSSAAPAETETAVPGTASTKAIQLPDRDIRDDAWIVALAEARDAKGKHLFSASKIFALVGGHRATVLARVKEIQEGVPPAQFRQDDQTTAPATYPVSKSA